MDQSELHHYLCQCHLGDDGQHDLFSFCGIGILFMFIEPSFQRGSRFSSCILPSGCQVSIAPVTENKAILVLN